MINLKKENENEGKIRRNVCYMINLKKKERKDER